MWDPEKLADFYSAQTLSIMRNNAKAIGDWDSFALYEQAIEIQNKWML